MNIPEVFWDHLGIRISQYFILFMLEFLRLTYLAFRSGAKESRLFKVQWQQINDSGNNNVCLTFCLKEIQWRLLDNTTLWAINESGNEFELKFSEKTNLFSKFSKIKARHNRCIFWSKTKFKRSFKIQNGWKWKQQTFYTTFG